MEYMRQSEAQKAQTTPSIGGTEPAQGYGNAAAQEALAGGGSLYDSLRERVGTELADLITEHLSEEELLGYIEPAIDDLIAKAREVAGGQELPISEEQLGGALATLDERLTQAAAELLSRLNLDERLAGFAQENPELIAAVALAGVAAWALRTNPDLPALDGEKALGNHTLAGALDLGPILDLTIQHIEARWAYSGEQLSASLRGFGGEQDGGWGAEGALAFDGERTDASLRGDYRSTDAGEQWNLAALLDHDGEDVDAHLDAAADHTGAWSMNGQLDRDGETVDAMLAASARGGTADGTAWDARGRLGFDRGRTTGHLAGEVDHTGAWRADGAAEHDGETVDARLEAAADSTGARSVEGALTGEDGDRRWSLLAAGSRDSDGETQGSLQGTWADTHEHFRSEAQGRADLGGSWSAKGGLVGLDPDTPWSLTASAGQTAADVDPTWSLTGEASGYLDEQKQLLLSGRQAIGPDESLSRLQMEYTPSDTLSASAWMEHTRTPERDLSAFGGEFNGRFGDTDAYARGWYRSDQTWEAAAGVSSGTEKDAMSWFAEGYTNRNELGEQDTGARAGFRLRF